MKKSVVLGLDGGTWSVLKPLIESNDLPVLRRLMKDGFSCTLQSTIPPYTGIAWTSFATGRNPGKHGIFDFVKFKKGSYDFRVINPKDIKCKTYYHYMLENGMRVVIVNLPGAFPQKIENGIFVADLLSPEGNKIIPQEIGLKYEKQICRYKVSPETEMFDEENYLKEVREIEKNRFELAKSLFINEEWDHFFLLFSGSDWASHSALKFFCSSKNMNLKRKFIDIFKDIDNYIGWFVDNMDKNTNLIIISDHGHTTRKGIFYINEWLCQNGYARRIPRRFEDPFLVLNTRRANINTFELGQVLTKILYKLSDTPLIHILRRIYYITRNITRISFSYSVYGIDFENSVAFCPTFSSFGIYINDVGDRSRLTQELINKLKSLKNPLNENQYIFKGVYRKEELYSGKYTERAPDIILLPSEGIELHIDTKVKSLFSMDTHNGGTHTINGIFLAYGPDIKSENKIHKKFSIMDIAPTLLHIHGLPIPQDMDGRVLKEIFKESSPIYKREVVDKSFDKTRIRSKIRELKRKGII